MKNINDSDKVKFLRWFVQRHQVKTIETVWLLNYIAYTPRIIERTNFVLEASAYKRSLFISTKDSKMPALLYRKNNVYSYDVEKILQDLQADFITPLYIECHFPDNRTCVEYLSVLFEDGSEATSLSKKENDEIEIFLQYLVKMNEKEALLLEIDKSLKDKNKKMFLKLTEALKKMGD